MTQTFWNIVGRLLFYPVLFAVWLDWKLRGSKAPEPLVPWMEVQHRQYEWDDDHWCDKCNKHTTHRYVEWLPDFQITDTCKNCGEEIVADIESRF